MSRFLQTLPGSIFVLYLGTFLSVPAAAGPPSGISAGDAESEGQAGRACAAAQDWRCAEQHFLRAFNLSPSRKEYAYGLADARFRLGRVSEAIALLNRLLAENPSDGETRTRLADLFVRAGRSADAAVTLESGAAAQGNGDPRDLYLAAARLRERRSEYGQAVLDYRASLSSADPSGSPALGSSLKQHVLYLLMSLGAPQQLARLPVAKELGIGAVLAPKREGGVRASTADRLQGGRVVVPGGLDSFARVLQMNLPEDSKALELTFSSILNADRRSSTTGKEFSLRQAALTYLRDYEDLLRHLAKAGLISANLDLRRGQDLVFPLFGDRDSLAKTRVFLDFFDFKLRPGGNGAAAESLVVKRKDEGKPARRRELLLDMGIEIGRPDQREIRLTLRDQEVPLMLGRDFWFSQLGPGKDRSRRSLLESMLGAPRQMELYVALASCTESVRAALVQAASRGNLADYADALLVFGRNLDVRNGQLELPGAAEAWEKLLGVPRTETGRFLLALLGRDDGRALFLYAGLSAASFDVRQYFTTTQERFQRLYECLSPYDRIKLKQPAASLASLNLGQIMQRLVVRGGSLQLSGSAQAAACILGRQSKASAPAGGSLALDDLPRLLDDDVLREKIALPTGEVLKLLEILDTTHPRWMTGKNVAEFAKRPEEAAVLLDLVEGLEPSPEQLADYIDYCRLLVEDGVWGRNPDRIRISESLFRLISLMRREGTIGPAESGALFGDAVARLRSAREAEFALVVARFLSSRLLVALQGPEDPPLTPDELILRGLAGRRVRDLMFEGRRLRYDASSLRLQNMKGAIEHQLFTPLSTLLEIYRLLENIPDAGDKVQEMGDSIRRLLGEVHPAQFPAACTRELRHLVAGVDLKAAQERWGEFQRVRNDPNGLRRLARNLAADLDPELGVSLLTYCYAYYGSPAIDTLAFDPNFVRKHDFLGPGKSPFPVWQSAHLAEHPDAGSYIQGSISGLGFVLAGLETASARSGLDGRDPALLPTMLAGLRSMRPLLLTDRAQEFVALTTRLGRELVTLGALDSSLRRWSGGILGRFVPPSRRESLGDALDRFETDALTRFLTPSEFFFLGAAYARAEASGERVPPINCPGLDRIREILADAARSGMGAFEEEVAQFGVLLRGRLGLGVFSADLPESYEDLDLKERGESLFDRMCDLKIRLADLQYSLGLPAFATELEGELALRDVLPGSGKEAADGWREVLDRIGRLSVEGVRGWIGEALSRGWLVPVSDVETPAEGGPQ